MTRNARKAFNKLKKMGVPVKEWHDDSRGHFWIDCEEPEAPEFLDYFGNFWGSDKLNEVLDSYDLYFEWHNAAYACVYDA